MLRSPYPHTTKTEDSSRKYLRFFTSIIYILVILVVVAACLWSCYLTWTLIDDSLYAALSPQELTRLAHSQGVNLFIPVNPLGVTKIVVICMAAVACAAGFIGGVQHLSATIRETNPYKCILPGLYLLFLIFLVVAGVLVAGACFGMSHLSKAVDEQIDQQLVKASEETGGLISPNLKEDVAKFITPLVAFYDTFKCTTTEKVDCWSAEVGKITCSPAANARAVAAANEVCSLPPRLDRHFSASSNQCSNCFTAHGHTQAAQVLCLCSSLLQTWIDAVSPKGRGVWVTVAFIDVVVAAVCGLLLIVWIMRRLACPAALRKSSET
ncbi:hypothetical protein Pmar_PMAR024718 [Perkinsus marinus ATCC 50983]|uniref:Uncharacterized protein n=1 Tax=Perkinsus marinus (strain ATCC 50983 / TXsc) TaxID=423536 RepID=C5M146_PERM5|nr:hypothetical protein Pmar_PMAR024718 [Perkinsus marinus ATCC 50983]EEQ97276.1 hypothetical protein Pmar_PMAR024718 [Perkinsus marinus ATCC 50983]|eukprot:XP_002764559.1 hypothetical protein Pmar_PMAR024718 [Perkinsus marinus ATCC 50983]